MVVENSEVKKSEIVLNDESETSEVSMSKVGNSHENVEVDGSQQEVKVEVENYNKHEMNGIEIKNGEELSKENNEETDGANIEMKEEPVSKMADDSAVGESMNTDSFMSPEDDEDPDDIALNGDDHSGEKLSKTNLYIRGLASDFNDRKLHDLCKRFGQIVSTKAIMHKQSFVCKGYGFVDFSSEEEAKRAVIELQKEGIPAQMARQQEQDLTNIYISNLPKGFDEKKLEEVFQKLGTVVSTRILRDQSGNTKKVGFVRMETQEMCEKVIAQVHNKPLEGYPDCKLLCKFADAGKRRKPMYAGGPYDHYDAYHQHNHHNSYYSNHQSAYTPYYANFPKGFNGPPSNAHPSVNGNSPAGVPWSPASSAPFGLNPLASTGALSYYNLLLSNSAAFGGVPPANSASGPGSLLSANPLAAAATLGGAPYFQNHSAALGQLGASSSVSSGAAAGSAAANSAIGHSPSSSAPSFLMNSSASHNHFSEASNAHSASQPNNTTIASLAQNVSNAHHHHHHHHHQGTAGGPNSQQGAPSHQSSLANSMNGGTGVDLAGLYHQQQQQSNAQQLISNLSHSMGHLQFNPQQQQQQQRHHPNSQAANMNGASSNNRGSGGGGGGIFYPQQNSGMSAAVQAAMLNGASSPLDNPQNAVAQNGFHSGNTPPSAADELQQHLKGANGGFNLNGSAASNGFNGQMNFSSAANGNNQHQYWAALQQQNGAAGVPQNAVAAYAAALASQANGALNGSGSVVDQQSSQNSANGAAGPVAANPATAPNGLHLMSAMGGRNPAATGANGPASSAQLQY